MSGTRLKKIDTVSQPLRLELAPLLRESTDRSDSSVSCSALGQLVFPDFERGFDMGLCDSVAVHSGLGLQIEF